MEAPLLASASALGEPSWASATRPARPPLPRGAERPRGSTLLGLRSPSPRDVPGPGLRLWRIRRPRLSVSPRGFPAADRTGHRTAAAQRHVAPTAHVTRRIMTKGRPARVT